MQHLQQLLLTAAQIFTPSFKQLREDDLAFIPTPAVGPLPRWSYTDLEVTLAYSWSGHALLIAIARHHELLARRGEGCTGAETARQVCLLVSGLPLPVRRARRQTPPTAIALRAVA
jgi:hypothetical protein